MHPMLKRQLLLSNTRFPAFKSLKHESARRLKNYLVVEEDGRVLGYAYASTYYARTAYDWTTELSIYLHEDARGRGLGNQLYDALEEELEKRGFLRFLACIAVPNEASVAMHEKRGYVQVAHFPKVGYKFEQWHDIVWMQKILDGPVRKIQ